MDKEQTPSLVQTLSYIQTNLKAHKNLHNSFGGYSYRSCEGILEALKPYLKDSDLALILALGIPKIKKSPKVILAGLTGVQKCPIYEIGQLSNTYL